MIAIKDMEMPKNCASCAMRVGKCKERIYMENRPDHCPLIEIKTDGNMISRRDAIDTIDYLLQHNDDAKRSGHSQVFINGMEDGYFRVRSYILSLPSAQPERTKRIIGKSRDGMTMWYQCESCNEPVDEKDLFCSGCGRRFEDGLLDKQTGGNR